jgi:hypothetical protein
MTTRQLALVLVASHPNKPDSQQVCEMFLLADGGEGPLGRGGGARAAAAAAAAEGACAN